MLVNPAFPDRLRPGDEVIVPAVAWSTTYYPLVNVGLGAVLVDVDLETFTLDPAAVERAIGPRTRAMMPVHLLGNPCDMRALGDLAPPPAARHRGHLRGARRPLRRAPGRHLRRHGNLQASISSHHISTIEGGVVVTNDDLVADLSRMLRAHGWTRARPEEA